MLAEDKILQIIEAFIFTAIKPIAINEIKNLLRPDYVLSKTEIRVLIQKLQLKYKDSSMDLVEVVSGYRFQTKEHVKPFLMKQHSKSKPKYSKVFLEVLAIIIYKQPVTKLMIENIRGVAIGSYILQSMLDKGWIKIVGRKEVLGRPVLYGTTKELLDYFCVNKLEDLVNSNIKDEINIKEELL